jgi:hypothetical protein
VLGPLPGVAAQEKNPPPGQTQEGRASALPFKLLFSGASDVSDTWGLLHFGVTPVRLLREITEPDFTTIGCFPLPDGRWEVFGQQMKERSRGTEHFQRVATLQLIRATTRDGVTFDTQKVVFESSAGPWSNHHAMAYNPSAKEYVILKLKADRSGFAYSAFLSADGRQWQEYPGNPLFYDGDAMSLFWSPVLRRFICVSKSLQPFRKRIRDHGGPTPSLNDDSLRDRRVLMLRSSVDGRTWEPSVSLSDVWNRLGRKAAVPDAFLTVPDDRDPPDLQFYSGNAFWYHDRAYMMVLNYAGSPLTPLKHGPQLDNEWWTSPDGLRWERPARGINVLGVFPAIPRLESNPLVSDSMIVFPRGKMLLGLEIDRISYIGARANGEFSTRPFVMPEADLLLNAASPAPERPFAGKQAYVMVAVVDASGTVLPGFEATKCVFTERDAVDLPLRWDGKSARELAGRTVRLRFHLRSANIYAVTATR